MHTLRQVREVGFKSQSNLLKHTSVVVRALLSRPYPREAHVKRPGSRYILCSHDFSLIPIGKMEQPFLLEQKQECVPRQLY